MTAPSRRAPHWLASALGVPALLVIFTAVVVLPAGYVLAHLSDLVWGARP